jgi:hypothetical protein
MAGMSINKLHKLGGKELSDLTPTAVFATSQMPFLSGIASRF